MVDNINSDAFGKEIQNPILNNKKKLVMGDGKSFGVSIFGKGFEINSGFEELFGVYDADGDGNINENEAQSFVRDLILSAGDDDVLDDSELMRFFNGSEERTEASERKVALFKGFLAMTLNGPQNMKIKKYEAPREETEYSSFKKNGSGVVVTFMNDFEGYIVETYDKGKVLREKVICTNCDMRADADFPRACNPNSTTHIIYDAKGKPIEQYYISKDTQFGSPFNEHTFFEYDKKGNLARKMSQKKNEESGSLTTTRTDYYLDGKIKEKLTTFEFNGHKSSELLRYAEDGETVISAKVTKEKDELIFVEEYDGANLENRLNNVPSKITVYDKATKAVKSITTNQFSEDGILIGQVVEDKVKNTKLTYDYSSPNGEIENSKQGGVGNCFYLETINSLNTIDVGKKILAGTFRKEVSQDENGVDKTTYKVAFGGASQIIEDLSNGIRNFPKEKIFIKPEYEITEDELKEACLKAGKDYSSGDKDVLLLELAYAKYRKDVLNTVDANEEDTGFGSRNDLIAGLDIARGWAVERDSLNGGVIGITMYLFTGQKSDVYMSTNRNIPVCKIDDNGNLSIVPESEQFNDEKMIKNESNVFNKRYDNIDEVIELLSADTDENGNFQTYLAEVGLNITSQVVDGKVVNNGGHAFTIKGIRGDKVLLINPWDSTKEVTMNLEEFKQATRMLNFLKPTFQEEKV